VVQQREGRVANPFGDGVAVVQDFELEAEADRHGKAAAQGKPGPGSSGAASGRRGGSPGAPPARGGLQAKGGYPGVKTRAYAITREQAQAAMAKVAEYESGRHRYSLEGRQCSTFALDVLRAARVPLPEQGAAPRPRVMYEALDDDS
jgi:hypothetical protein